MSENEVEGIASLRERVAGLLLSGMVRLEEREATDEVQRIDHGPVEAVRLAPLAVVQMHPVAQRR